MAVKPGYKLTEVGVIPDDWECVPSAYLVTYFGGNAFRSEAAVSDGIRWLKIANVGIQRAQWEAPSFLPPAYGSKFKDYLLREGDVVMALTRPILNNQLKVAKLAQSDVPALLNQRVAKVIAGSGADLGFIYYTLQMRRFADSMSDAMAGSDPPNIGSKTLGRILVAVPKCVLEQRDIATALSDVDALLSSLERLIAKKRDLKQAAMQQLLTGQTRLPGFTGDWQVRALGDLIRSCSSGATPRRDQPDFYKGDVRWITSGELNYNVITDTVEKITSEAVARTNLKVIPKGTFLMAITGLEAAGTRGSCAIVGEPSTTNQSCMAIFPTSELLTEYLFHYYVFRGDALALQYCQGSKQQSYTAKLVRKLPISVPPTTEEQAAIAGVLSDMDTELAALEQRLAKNHALKQGMMQELLTGRTRLL
ncbi:restriction endonuclease subunit S [uncultured Pseudomonas sp.]|uniref:restriction endonuclease subunit S n=1 Tax=uncultured Pseudomonas sp. TaxID=114707 RepID=UPI0030D7C5D6|tara:strand:+ start:8227 stop:9489 length:1263 start_codon:yes stop_codon:yes gene_type:complete